MIRVTIYKKARVLTEAPAALGAAAVAFALLGDILGGRGSRL